MKRPIMTVLILLGYACLTYAADAVNEQYDFITGKYVCIGKRPDSSKTYQGRVQISRTRDGVKIVSMIDGETIEATGIFGSATPDKISVLRVKFSQKGTAYEETCIVNSDLDNYARLTCHLYSNKTTSVGLEALFSDHGQLQR